MKRARLDSLVVERGLAGSRERARALILAGQVQVNGQIVSKAGTAVGVESELRLLQPDHPYVGRGGLKLAHALDAFAIDPTGVSGARCRRLDRWIHRRSASTRRGDCVVALDVGHGQLDWKIRNDPRVVVLERLNARTLTAEQLPATARTFDLITIDVSFISLRQVLPALTPLLASGRASGPRS